MKTGFIVAVLTLLALQMFAAPSADSLNVEQMYGGYDKDGKYRAMQQQMDRIHKNIAQAESEKSGKKTVAMWLALLIGLTPLGFIGVQAIKEKAWKSNPRGTMQALAYGLAGGAVLFALNYGIFLLKIEYGSNFSTVLVCLLVISLIIISIYAIKKKG